MRNDIEALAEQLAQNPKQKVFGYCRISSSKQEQGLSLPAQQEAIQKYCAERGLGDPYIVTETSTAGKRMFSLPTIGPRPSSSIDDDAPEEEGLSRPRLLMLLGHMAGLKGSHLVVWRLDRIARLSDEREVLYQLLTRGGAQLHTTDASERFTLEHGDPNDPMSSLVRQIFGAFSQYEKAVIELRMQSGMRFKAARGGFTGGRVPAGYMVVDGELKIDPVQARMIRYIYFMRHHYKMTLRSISEHLAAHGEGWTHTKIHRVLNHENLYRGNYRDRFGTLHRRPDLVILTDNGDFNYTEEFING